MNKEAYSSKVLNQQTNKSKVIGYIRVSTEKQNLQNQKLAILDYANKNGIVINKFVDITISSRRAIAERKILETLSDMHEGDTLISTELSRLGRSTIEVLTLTKQIVDKGIKVIAIKENLVLDKNNKKDAFTKVMLAFFTILGELERDLISQRTIEGLAVVRASGKKLGKPFGSIQKSIYDKHLEVIKQCLAKGMNVPNISKWIAIGTPRGLFDYIKRRNLKK